MPTLADELAIGRHFERSESQVGLVEVAEGQKGDRPGWVQFFEGLPSGDAKFLRLNPAEKFLRFHDALQSGDGLRGDDAA